MAASALAATSSAIAPVAPVDAPSLDRAIERACRRIAPLWPLEHFVAVNPFLGFTDQSFGTTAALLKRVAKVDITMGRPFYRAAIERGEITDADLAAALAGAGPAVGTLTVADLKRMAGEPHGRGQRPPGVVATVAEVLDGLAKGDRQASLTGFMIDEISKFCAAYFDRGQASWRMAGRDAGLYAAWREIVVHDRNPDAMGLPHFRRSVIKLPATARAAIIDVVGRLGIPAPAVEDYLHRALLDIGGWAAWARYLGWNAELEGGQDTMLEDLLAVRVAWGYGLFTARTDDAFKSAWAEAMQTAARLPAREPATSDRDTLIDVLLQDAYDIAARRRLVGRLTTHAADRNPAGAARRPKAQAAFCIDVRSEIIRRAFETVVPDAETIGFAGFFGFPIEYVPIGQAKGGAHCPVLLKPSFIVCEAVRGTGEDEEQEIMGLRLLRRRAAKAWKSFKASAVSSFSYVETAGLLFAPKIASDSLGLTRTVERPSAEGLDPDVAARTGPRLQRRTVGGRTTGFDAGERVRMAKAVLQAMSLTSNFGRIVLLVGHGSTTVNNPHGSGLDCGACGGHTGEANARVAAAILNDADVRVGLVGEGIAIPQDTWFVAALHDTTTDDIRMFDTAYVPDSFVDDVATLEGRMRDAASLARIERSRLLGVDGGNAEKSRQILARSRDWSEVRPEWGLAGNTAFIAAPRALTAGLDLGGRVFLHSYDHALDTEKGVLELIMTAPMVVASWINLQYYASTVNNAVFGSGNKVLHNVVGQLGVLEGNAGDLRVGLPIQSVHDGERFVHEPIRLNVFIAAPEAAMDAVIARHAGVRDLVSNGWVFLHSLSDDGRTIRRYAGDGRWEAVA